MAWVELDDWEGRLAALAAGIRYRAPALAKLRRASRSEPPVAPDDDPLALLTEPCPCDHCSLRQLCATRELACRRYALFLQGRGAGDWEAAPRAPTRELFSHLGLSDNS